MDYKFGQLVNVEVNVRADSPEQLKVLLRTSSVRGALLRYVTETSREFSPDGKTVTIRGTASWHEQISNDAARRLDDVPWDLGFRGGGLHVISAAEQAG